MYAFASIALAALILPMSPFEAERDGMKIGLDRADIPTLFSRTRDATGALEIPVRYQLRSYTDWPYRISLMFREHHRAERAFEPIMTWTSPPFEMGASSHVNAVKVFRVPCQPGKYAITVGIEQFIEGIDRETGKPFARWSTAFADTYSPMTIR